MFQHLDLATLSPAALARAREQVLVASALWGVVALEDRIPAYRLSIGARLPALDAQQPGCVVASGAPPRVLDEPGQLVVDLRSGGMPRPGGRSMQRSSRSGIDRRRQPISHMAKAVRGTVARRLLQARTTATEPADVARAAEGDGVGRVELHAPTRTGGAWIVNVIATPRPARRGTTEPVICRFSRPSTRSRWT